MEPGERGTQIFGPSAGDLPGTDLSPDAPRDTSLELAVPATIGLAGINRDVLAVRTRGAEHRLSDINVAAGSGRLDHICEQINAKLMPRQ